LNAVVRDAEKKAHMFNQFQADFVKTRRLWLFDKELTAKGRLIFQKPGRFWMTLDGDIQVEIVSDGKHIKVIHGKSDEEVFPILGDRDRSRFADPLMLLIDSIGSGSFRKFSIERTVEQADSLLLEIDPKNELGFESTEKIFLVLSKWGEVQRVTIVYRNGSVDDTVFKSWAILDSEGPEISRLNQKLRALADSPSTGLSDRGKTDHGDRFVTADLVTSTLAP